ncbi:MAG: hypothetical protein ACUVTL_01650 [Thermoproteota archaeon]
MEKEAVLSTISTIAYQSLCQPIPYFFQVGAHYGQSGIEHRSASGSASNILIVSSISLRRYAGVQFIDLSQRPIWKKAVIKPLG